MGKRESTPATRRMRWTVAVRIAFALAALTPVTAAGAEDARAQLMPASVAPVALVAAGVPPRDAAEWERLRRRLS